MALPMVSVSVLVLLTPFADGPDRSGAGHRRLLERHRPWCWSPAGLAGVVAGSLIPLDAFWSRSLLRPLRILQDLLAFDFYTDRIYRATIVAFVAGMARITNGFDRLAVNGLVNRIADVSMASAQSLKLGVSGRLQSYVFTVVVAIVLLVGSLAWLGG